MYTLTLLPILPPCERAEVTAQTLADKIAQLNAVIDDVAQQLKSNDSALVKDEVAA